MKRYKLTTDATRDFDEIIQYYLVTAGADVALRFNDEFEEAFEALAADPGFGSTLLKLTSEPVRFWKLRNYLIIYDPQTRPVDVLAIYHGARHVRRLLRRRLT